MHKGTIFWWGDIEIKSTSRPSQISYTYRNVPQTNKKQLESYLA